MGIQNLHGKRYRNKKIWQKFKYNGGIIYKKWLNYITLIFLLVRITAIPNEVTLATANRFFNDKITQIKQYLTDGYVDIFDDYEIEGIRHYRRYKLRKIDREIYQRNLDQIFKLQAECLRTHTKNFMENYNNLNDSGFPKDKLENLWETNTMDNTDEDMMYIDSFSDMDECISETSQKEIEPESEEWIENVRSNEPEEIPEQNISPDTWPEFNPFQIENSVWHDGRKIEQFTKEQSIQNLKENARLLEHEEKWKNSNEQEENIQIKFIVTYLNIPHMKTRNICRNIFHQITLEFPETNIFTLSEIYKHDYMKHIYEPPGYKIIYHMAGQIKTSAIMYKISDEYSVEQLNYCGIITTAAVKINGKSKHLMKISAFYRSPSKNQKILLKDYGYEENYEEYSFAILKYLREYIIENHCAFGDINWNLSKNNLPKTRYLEKKASDQYGDLLNMDLWNNRISFQTKKGGSKIDIALCPYKFIYDKFTIFRNTYTDLSDHHVATLVMPSGIKIRMKKLITSTRILYKKKNKSQYEEDKIQDPNTSEYTDDYIKFVEKSTEIWNDDLQRIKNAHLMEITPTDATTIYKSLCELGRFAYPKLQRSIKTNQNHGKYGKEIMDLDNKCTDLYRSLSAQNISIRENTDLNNLKSKLRSLKQKHIRKYWTNQLSQRIQDKNLNWSLVQKFRQQTQSIPIQIQPDQFALTFLELMYNYSPLENIQRTNIEDFMLHENEDKFDFDLPIVPKSGNKMTSLISYTHDGKGSQLSMAMDFITKDFIKILPNEYYGLLATLITKLLENGVYIEEFRDTRCIPIYKKSDKNDPKNYRPIHIISSIGNLCEKIFARQAMQFVEDNNLLWWCQYGFRGGRESGMLLNEFRRYFLKTNLTKTYCAALVTDMTNAFGSTDVDQIIEDLAPLFKLRAMKALRTFLTRSKIMVDVNNKKSGVFYSAERGSGQGSSLSAQLYVILMRQSHVLSDKFVQLSFADDATAITHANTYEELNDNLNLALKAFVDFCTEYNMTINVKKTFIYLFGKKCDKSNINIFIGEEKLKVENQMELLGLNLNGQMSFQKHYSAMGAYFQYKISMIGQFSTLCDKDNTRMLINSYLVGKFNYGSPYIPIQPDNVYRRLQGKINTIIQNRKSNKEERTEFFKNFTKIPQWDLLQRINMKSLKNIHRQNQLTRLGKLTETAFPPREFEQFIECLEIRGSRRQSQNQTIPFFVQKPKTLCTLPKLFFTCAPMMWAPEFAKLPAEIKNTIGTKLFNKNVKKFFNNRCQHQEHTQNFCEKCENSTREYACPQNLLQAHRNWSIHNKVDMINIKNYDTWIETIETNNDLSFQNFITINQNTFHQRQPGHRKFHNYLTSNGWAARFLRNNDIDTNISDYQFEDLFEETTNQ